MFLRCSTFSSGLYSLSVPVQAAAATAQELIEPSLGFHNKLRVWLQRFQPTALSIIQGSGPLAVAHYLLRRIATTWCVLPGPYSVAVG